MNIMNSTAMNNITDANCHLLTNFNLMLWAANQVIAQGKLGECPNGTCVYRQYREGQSTLKCAVGHCIPDADFKDDFEGTQIDVGRKSPTEVYGYLKTRFSDTQIKCLEYLQMQHDSSPTFDAFVGIVAKLRALSESERDSLLSKIYEGTVYE